MTQFTRRTWPDLIRVEAVGKYAVRFFNGSPDMTIEGRLSRAGSDIASQKRWDDAATYLD